MAAINFNSIESVGPSCKSVANRLRISVSKGRVAKLADLLEQFAQISALTKKVREELYRMLVKEAKYFR